MIEPSGTPPSARSPLRKPDASSPRREGTFAVVKVRADESKRNRSVNVPPTSIPTITLMRAPVDGRAAYSFHPPLEWEGRLRREALQAGWGDSRSEQVHPTPARDCV